MTVDQDVLKRAQEWTGSSFDEETIAEVKAMIDENSDRLTDSFYKDLEFGTGGMRGVMGAGTNRMNKYTIGMATQGLINYLAKSFPDEQISMAIAYDSRNNSKYFAEIAAKVLSANGALVFLFEDLRPTPELSFAIRHLKCHSGIVITASHNPKEYNGYKVYWNDGAQLVPPHDKNVIDEIRKIKTVADVKWEGADENITIIGNEVDTEYIEQLQELSLISNEDIEKHGNLKVIYSPLHGTGKDMVPAAMEAFGFTNVISVKEQSIPDGNFPTVKSPNPEESVALEMALNLANEENADLVMATDPDSDRVGIAVRNDNNEMILLNGNETGAILIHYMLTQWKEQGLIDGNQYIVKTIVTSELLKNIALKNEVDCYDVLTGFKWIAEIIRKLEGERTYIVGGEESYGYLIGENVRDKDAVAACCMIAEAAVWAKSKDMTMYQLLKDIHQKYGFFQERLLSVTRKGKKGAEEIAAMMERFRNNPPEALNGQKISLIKDYQLSTIKNQETNNIENIDLPKSNVLQFVLEDGSIATMRPSGTEPKIKFYFSVNYSGDDIIERYDNIKKELETKIDTIINDLSI